MKPTTSPCCRAACWWHGWRERWCGKKRIPVRRLLCTHCRKVKTLMPRGLWHRFQAGVFCMVRCCLRRLQNKPWKMVHPLFSRQRMRWWVRVIEKIKKVWKNLFEGLRHLAEKKQKKRIRPPLSRFWLPHQRVS